MRLAIPGRPGGLAPALPGQQQQLLPRHMRLRQQLANAVRAMQRPSSAGGSSVASASAATPSASRGLSPTAPPPSALSSPGPRAAPSLGLQLAPSPLGCALAGLQPIAASAVGGVRAESPHARTAAVIGSPLGRALSGLQPCEGDASGGIGASAPAPLTGAPVAPAQPAGEHLMTEGPGGPTRCPNRAKAHWSTVARLLLPTRGAAATSARVASTARSCSTGSPSCGPHGSAADGQGSAPLDCPGHPTSPPSPDTISSLPSTPTGWQSVLAANLAHAGSGSAPDTVVVAFHSPSRDSRSPSATLSDTEVAARAASGGTTTHGSASLWRSVSALPSGHKEAAGTLSSSPTAGSPPDGHPVRMALLKGVLSARRRQEAAPASPLAGAHAGMDGPRVITAASPGAAEGTVGQEPGSSLKLVVRRNGVGGGQERQVQVVFRAVAGKRPKGRKRGQEGQGVYLAQWSSAF